MKRFLTLLVAVAATFSGVSSGVVDAGTFVVNSRTELQDQMIRLRAIQFLRHATFGPTETDIAYLSAKMRAKGIGRGAEEWINEQFALPATSHWTRANQMVMSDGFSNTTQDIWSARYRNHAFWDIAIREPDQLRQRAAWALAQIVVVGSTGENFDNQDADVTGEGMWMGLLGFHDMLVNNTFGNYQDILQSATIHPIMGTYLSHNRNRKENPALGIYPDENYAREIMQLYSIGLNELNIDGTLKLDSAGNPIPTYDLDTVKSLARVFTGLYFAQNSSFYWGPVNFKQNMVMYYQEHDTGPKTLLNGVTLPGGANSNTTAMAEVQAAVQNVFNHPNVGPFVARRLIQGLVCSNPSKGYIQRVAEKFNNNGSGVRGDLKAVIKQILLDREAWAGVVMTRRSGPYRLEVTSAGSERSRMQEPVIQYTSFLRRYTDIPKPIDRTVNGLTIEDTTDYQMLPDMTWQWKQAPYRAPTVFNFFGPDFQPNGDVANFIPSEKIPNGKLVAPEMKLYDSVVANRQANEYRWHFYNASEVPSGKATTQYAPYVLYSNTAQIRIWCNSKIAIEANLISNPTALVNYLDQVHCNGTMPVSASNALIASLTSELGANPSQATKVLLAKAAVIAVLTSPYSAIIE